MAKKRKNERIGTISGMELIKTSRPPQDIPFRTGGQITTKDRPRKKVKPRDVDKFY